MHNDTIEELKKSLEFYNNNQYVLLDCGLSSDECDRIIYELSSLISLLEKLD